MTDILQENHAREQDYLAAREKLDRQEKALRDEYRRIEASDPTEEFKQRILAFVQQETLAARRSLREAINGVDPETHLRELIPPALFAMFSAEVESLLLANVVANDGQKRAKLAELNERIQAVSRQIATCFEAYRVATSPRG